MRGIPPGDTQLTVEQYIEIISRKTAALTGTDPDHGRIIQISLTKEGIRLLSRCNKVISALERQMLRDLNDNQILSLRQQLRDAVGVLREL